MLAALVRLGTLNEKGLITNYPGPIDSVLQDAGGIRAALADYGIGFSIHSANTFSDNVLNNAKPSHPQEYHGQGPTLNASIDQIQATFDTEKIGIPNGQVSVMGILFGVSHSPDGPTNFAFGRLTYFRSLWNDHVEIKVGYGATNF